jgi:hypothetical protein
MVMVKLASYSSQQHPRMCDPWREGEEEGRKTRTRGRGRGRTKRKKKGRGESKRGEPRERQ